MGSHNSSNKNDNKFNNEINETESNGLNKIKYKYVILKIFENLKEVKYLKIIKYNKKILRKLNIEKNYFKEFSETKTPIEIQLIPFKEKFGKFINHPDENDMKYFHIFFNDINIEKKRNYLYENENVKNIKIKIDYSFQNISGLFQDCLCIESINFIKFFRANIKDMSHMFSGCFSLKEINLSNFNTNNATSLRNMFSIDVHH